MIVITGGAGFIGSNIAATLEERGQGLAGVSGRPLEIAVCDRLGTEGKWRNIARRDLAAVIAPEELLAWLDRHGERVDLVIHMGAVSSTVERDADLIARTNVTLPQDLWDWCTLRRVRFIYASSAAIYGDGSQGFDDDASPETLARLKPLNAYGWSKNLFDRQVARKVAAGDTPPQWVGLRFFNVYGPNEYHKGPQQSVAAHLFPAARAGQPARLFRSHRPDYADGGQERDFVSVMDCADVVLWLAEHPAVSGLFNLGTGNARSFADLAAAVYRALGREPVFDFIDTPPAIRDAYQYHTQARMDRLRAAGYTRPFTSLEDGVAAYVQHYLNSPDPYR